MRIFVSIAAYRDPELAPTVRDLIAKADHPDALRICICDQFGPEAPELPDDLRDDPRIVRIAIPWHESRGACWARARIQDEFDDEDYYLQLDSHHRFIPGWDTALLAELAMTGRDKALLTGYVNAYHPDEPLDDELGPQELHFDAFHADGIAVFCPWGMPDERRTGRPIRGRFLSGHFIFAPGAFVREVPYDRELYFIGEEISLSVRAFMEGWYIFHPSRVILYHEYTRAYRENKHWSDHEEGRVTRPWYEYDITSRQRVVELLTNREGRGSVRTLREYEDYAGLCFATQRVHPLTLRGVEPPTPVEPGWAESGSRYAFVARIPAAMLDEADEAEYWRLLVYDRAGIELVRQAVWPENLRKAERDGDDLLIPVAFDAADPPVEWMMDAIAVPGLSMVRGRITLTRAEPPRVWVTALLDLGRDALPDPRPWDEYRARFAELLGDALHGERVVVYCHPRDAAWVRDARRGAPLDLRPLTHEMLAALPGWDRIEAIRTDPAWRAQASWLGASPQALLPGYAALVMHKLRLVADVAAEVPDDHAVWWVDAGLTRTVHASAVAALAFRPPEGTLRFFAYPYPLDAPEVHGFARARLDALAGEPVGWVLRGGFFGGLAPQVRAALPPYEALRSATLDEGLLGTEESLFSILAARGEPAFAGVVAIGEDGLLPNEPCGRLPLRVNLPVGPDRIALLRELSRIDRIDRAGAPAHLTFGGGNAWAHLTLVAPWCHEGDILDVEETHEGEDPTFAFIQGDDRRRAMETLARVPSPPWIARFVQTAPTRPLPAPNAGRRGALYVLTFNAPAQFALWLERTHATCPALLALPVRVLVNNSTDRATDAAYAALCARWGFVMLSFDNVGITGGRVEATRHFLRTSDAHQMWYFEDDMTLSDAPGLCRNGFTRRVEHLVEAVTDVMANEEGLDLIKLSYTEFFGCHGLDWAWVNTPRDERAEHFPRGSAPVLHTIRSTRGVAWALGDVHYSHWPTVLTRRGATHLLGEGEPPPSETDMMLHVHRLQRAGQFTTAVLLASPIEHLRVADYGEGERVEWRG